MKPVIVLSAVNFTEMGPLSVLKDALRALSTDYCDDYEVVALVHRRSLFDVPGIKFLEFPRVKSSWIRRLWFEFFGLRKLSRELHPYLWLSMHDISPSVSAEIRAVYCHNPSPFFSFRLADLLLDWKFALFTLFYRFLYGINIHKNKWVIVQQDWLRQAFRRMYGVDRVIVAHPAEIELLRCSANSAKREGEQKTYRFFYPCFPRVFKNVECLLRAAQILENEGMVNFEVWLTFDGSENRYAARFVRSFGHMSCVKFLGGLKRAQVFERYEQTDCLVFPSQLETWGMPITEFKAFHQPMLLADLPYAHETAGDHDQVAFFAPGDARQLAERMRAAIEGKQVFERVHAAEIEQPHCKSWRELFAVLLSQST